VKIANIHKMFSLYDYRRELLEHSEIFQLLADRTNGWAYAIVFVVCRRLWRYVLWLHSAS